MNFVLEVLHAGLTSLVLPYVCQEVFHGGEFEVGKQLIPIVRDQPCPIARTTDDFSDKTVSE